MPVAAPSAAVQAVRDKYVDIAIKHNDHLDEIDQLQRSAFDQVLPAVLSEVELEEDVQAQKHVRAFLKDKSLLFRFYRRNRYSLSNTLDMLSATLTWRLRTDLDSLSLGSLHPLYTSPNGRPPLFWCNAQCLDLYGRPLGVISLQSLERVINDEGKGGLEECREYIVGCMESVRRYLAVQYAQSASRAKSRRIDVDKIQAGIAGNDAKDDKSYRAPPLQMVIVFSLASSGMANLELELLPFLLDLLKNHFPSMVGAVYILHFGWVHSGMWALAKRILPEQALAKIFFPNAKELKEHFNLGKLPVALGGEMEIEMDDETNDVMHKYARPHWNSRFSRPSSRSDLSKLSANASAERNNLTTGADNGDDAAADEGDVEDVEASSAPPSPRGQSGTSTPMHGFARTPRSLSRVGSFDSLVDEFYSIANSPILSRSATPRTSRPTTPHAEMSGFQFTSTNGLSPALSSQLRLTPSAYNKLQHVQRTRAGMRSRTSSDAAALPDIVARQSPAVSRGASPERFRRQRAATSALSTAGKVRTSNSVRFDSDNALGMNLNGVVAANEGASGSKPIKRVGSLRDFRLRLDDLAQPDAGIDDTDSDSSRRADSDGEDGALSDRSGKVTERTDVHATNGQQTSRATRFFSLLRRGRPATEKAGQSDKIEAGREKGESIGSEDATLHASHAATGIPASDTLISLPPEPVSPGSPRLQVPDIEEPPLSEVSPIFSRRSRLHGLPGHVSPYNAANPFYGYPAYPSAGAGNAQGSGMTERGGIHSLTHNDPRRRYHFRRRKRDLVRTLMYLFVLRLLALHRHVRSALMIAYRATMRTISVGGLTFDDGMDEHGVGINALNQQQYQRYQRLRNAGARFADSSDAAIDTVVAGQQGLQHRPASSRRRTSQDVVGTAAARKPKPRPLVALGFRKRYLLLTIIVAFTLLRREWQMRKRFK